MSDTNKTAPPFTHSFRDPKDDAKPWQQRVFDFMDFKLEEQAPAANTVAAENGLKIPPSHYFYVMKVHRPFDYIIFIYQLAENVASELKGVSPFDTGGLWHDYHVKKSMNENDKQDLFDALNYSLCEYETHFQTYLQTAYTNASCPPEECYLNCEEPAQGWWTHHKLDLKESNDKRAWCWEARIPYKDIKNVLQLKRIYLSKQDYEQLKKEISIEETKQKYLPSFTELTRHYAQHNQSNDESARDLAVKYLSKLSLRSPA